MSELCNWSEDRLATRHPRYAKIFRRQAESEREGQEAGHHRQDSENGGHEGDHGDSDDNKRESPAVAALLPGRARKLVSPPPRLPAPPQPSADKALRTVDVEEATKEEARRRSSNEASLEDGDVDVWAMKPVEAVDMLCAYVELLIKEASQKPRKPLSPPVSSGSSNQPSRTGTPAPPSSNMPSNGEIDAVEITRNECEPAPAQEPQPAPPPEMVVTSDQSSPEEPYLQRVPKASRTPIDSPVSNPRTPIHSRPSSPRLPHIVVTEIDKKVQTRHLAKRFFCKSVPNVSLAAYLGRIHKYCHMSTAVYLAAGIYIERLSQVGGGENFSSMSPPTSSSNSLGDKDIPVVELAPKSMHRLLLAAIRVANKALSDLYWPHKRVADVGGVSQLELQRLEVSMCYLCDFKLQVNLGELESWVRRARSIGVVDASVNTR